MEYLQYFMNARDHAEYMKRIRRMLKSGEIKRGINFVKVSHDNYCDLLNHRGDCNCEPDINIQQESEVTIETN